MSKKEVISREVAIKELTEFLKQHLKKEFRNGKTISSEKIEEDYPDVLYAMEDGNLVFVNGKPEYTLLYPLKNEQGEDSITKVSFRSRIKGADKTILINGIDPKKQLGDYMIKVISYITQIDSNELVKKLEKEDFEVLNQICSVF